MKKKIKKIFWNQFCPPHNSMQSISDVLQVEMLQL